MSYSEIIMEYIPYPELFLIQHNFVVTCPPYLHSPRRLLMAEIKDTMTQFRISLSGRRDGENIGRIVKVDKRQQRAAV